MDGENKTETKRPFGKADYEHLATHSVKRVVGDICNAIENELIIFVLKRKFLITGDNGDSSLIAKEANETFMPEKPLDGESVDLLVSTVMSDAENGKFGGSVVSGMAISKGLMRFCQNFKENEDEQQND